MILNSIRQAGVAMPLVLVLAGCANQTSGRFLQSSLQGVVGDLGGNGAVAAASNVPFGAPPESSFKDILVAQSGAQWPRVALNVTALQPTAYKSMIMTWNNSIPSIDCMRLSAVVWTDAKTSREIPEETFCVSQMHKIGNINSTGEIMAWGMFEDRTPKTPNTGRDRTNGPIPPAKLFPEGADYKNFFNSSQASGTFSVLARLMGYDLSLDGVKDRRLWVVSFPTEGEILGGQKVLR